MSTTISRSRWILKKTLRSMLASSSLTPYLVNREPIVRVLTYHRFGERQRDPFCVSVHDFEQQMSYIAEHNLAVSLQDVEDFLAGNKNIPDYSLLITIDDGFRSTCLYALPILKHYALPAVAFICPGLIDLASDKFREKHNPEPYINWSEAEKLQDGGITIGSHTMEHKSVAQMPRNKAHQEIFLSKQTLQKRLGNSISAFAYPYGTNADFNKTTEKMIYEAGYSCAFTSQHGIIREGSDAFLLPRVKVEGGERLWLFRRIAHGGMDAWRWVDRAFWRIQASGNM